MNTTASTTLDTPKRSRRSPGDLPPPPPGVEVVTRVQAAEFMGAAIRTFTTWENEGRVTIPRYRTVGSAHHAVFYAKEDLARLREEFKKREEPYPDPERPGVYRIPIQRHKERVEVLIDSEDLHQIRGKRWHVCGRSGSADLDVVLSSATERATPLKRFLMGVDGPECAEQIVCYVNGDPLDCRRGNLVIKTRTEANLGKAKLATRAGRPTSSKYRGVLWDARRRLWKAQIGSRDDHRQLGRFRDEAQAAAAHDAAAREIFGAAAVLNFPDGNVPAPTFLGLDGQIVREKNKYRVPRGLPTPPPGVAMLTREEAAAMLEVNGDTFGGWLLAGQVSIPRYREKAHTGAPILYAAADIARLREELDKVGQPYPDPHPARAGVWRVPLRTLGGFIEALIDEADLPIVQGRKWNFAIRTGDHHNKGSVFLVGPRDVDRVQLNRLIMGLHGEGQTKRVLHANGNPLDCRRENLVISSPEKTTRRGYKLLHRCGRPTTSRFKGVCWLEREGGWQAQIRVDDKPRRLGMFDDEEDAALAYDEAAREIWGAEARVNFPEPGELPSAAAPVDPADLFQGAPAAKLPGKPADFAAVLNPDGSVTLSWRSAHSAASAGVTFAVLRKLPGQSEFARIGTAEGSTSQVRRPFFTDATVPGEHLNGAAEGKGAEYIVQGCRGATLGEASDVLVVAFGEGGTFPMLSALERAA